MFGKARERGGEGRRWCAGVEHAGERAQHRAEPLAEVFNRPLQKERFGLATTRPRHAAAHQVAVENPGGGAILLHGIHMGHLQGLRQKGCRDAFGRLRLSHV